MSRIGLFVLMTACFAILGCDQDWPVKHSTSIIEGTIEYDGRSLVDATVVFVPQFLEDGSKRAPFARAKTDSRGMFILKADGESGSQQIAHGNYRVIISREVNGREGLPEAFNRKSELRYRHQTQEAYSRPVFRLGTDGLAEQE